ncbi:hypothetical protein QBC39DRAFT_347198 [Podospora conica]|nr:hypothetical protein QBC39DRAFT_347198 [Schizothecium conicum]
MRTRASRRASPLFFSDSVTRYVSFPAFRVGARDSRSELLEMELNDEDDDDDTDDLETTSLIRRASKTLFSEDDRRGIGGGRERGVFGGGEGEEWVRGCDGWMWTAGEFGDGVALGGDGLAVLLCVGVVVVAGCGWAASHRRTSSAFSSHAGALAILLEFLLGTGIPLDAASRAAGRENSRSCWRRVMKSRVSKAGPQARLDATTTTRTWDIALRPSRRLGWAGLGLGFGRDESRRHRSGDSLERRDLASLGMARRRKMHEPRMESRESEMGWIISRWFRSALDVRGGLATGPKEDYRSETRVRFRAGLRRRFALLLDRPLAKKTAEASDFFTWRWPALPKTHGRQGS